VAVNSICLCFPMFLMTVVLWELNKSNPVFPGFTLAEETV
jgi:hypothetical protein